MVLSVTGITRSRTAEFKRRRPARLQTSWDSGESADDAALIGPDSGDEITPARTGKQPDWAAHLSEAKATMVETQTMMKRLTTMHKEHIEKQSLFDNGMEQEHAIEIETSKITQSFHRCQKLIQAISRKSGLSESQAGQRLGKSAASAAARDLQDLSMTFRKSQASYLKRMRGRDERERGYKSMPGMDAGPADDEDDMFDVDTGFSDEQQAQVRDNTNIVRGREKEITKVVESIHELSEIFKDLANLVVEQGTMLDRIDYNIEMTATRIEKGFEELEKAEKYQASGTKKRIIFFLIILCVLFFFIVVITKNHKKDDPSATVTTVTTTTTTLATTTVATTTVAG